MGLGEYKLVRFRGICGIALFGVLLSGTALAGDIPLLTDAEFRTFATEDLDLRILAQGSADVIAVTSETEIPGYPLSVEELNLVIETPEPAAGFGRAALEANYVGDSIKQP
ncbi:MAG: hypothetical protein OEU26_36330, partial [Candidatus Tectomicrobia bacterium]|nr:hypothetical protein [Candidatus Tectomicrobia bacterium]